MQEKTVVYRDYSISAVRCVSMCFIILCHFMQLFFHWSWMWFNVGVYMFLWISGFLYGGRSIPQKGFLLRNVKKILVSYYIVFIPAGVVLYFFCRTTTAYELIHAMALDRTVYGGSHLWFIPTILFCYCATPALSRYFTREEGEGRRLLKLLFLLGLTFLIVGIFIRFFSPAMISSYILGFYFARVKDRKLYKRGASAVFILAILVNGLQILGDHVLRVELPAYSWIYQYGHLTLGGALFLGLKKLFSKVSGCRLLRFTDWCSYEIYLVHHFLIIGPLSLMWLTESVCLNILLVLLCSAVAAAAVKMLSIWIHKILDRIIERFAMKLPVYGMTAP